MNNLIIHPSVEPGVIDNYMIQRCILEEGPKEEAGRLFAEEGVHFEELTVTRLEFQNILRIDHLWMLKSLRKLTLAHNLIEKIENLHQLTSLNELDLSFNKITKIENLECLVNIEILTLFHNNIKKIENLDALENLLVFSIGDNLIEDYKEAIYLRRFRKLRSLSFKGNPCCDDPMTNAFLKAGLPRITYLNYQTITEEDRENSAVYFRGLLRKLDEADEKTEKERLAKEQYDAKVEFYALSFVEYLSGPELLETMFEKDPDGSLLIKFGGELIPFYEQYKEQYVETMETLVEFAQIAYTLRQNEIKLFKDLVDTALEESVAKSKEVIDIYVAKKKPLLLDLTDLITKVGNKEETFENIETDLMDLGETFNDILYDLWKSLMTIEMNLYEQCEETRVQFAVNMTEMITKLMEAARNAFGEWRESEGGWSMKQFEILTKNLGNKVLLGDAPHELIEVMTDRDTLINVIAQSTDNHMRFIDTREDVLMTRANKWKDDLVQGTNDNEIKRNRDRILEINYYVDNQRGEWNDLQMNFAEAPDPDAVAILADDE